MTTTDKKTIKPVIYQLFPRLFTNTCNSCVPYGTIAQNGAGKMNDINDFLLSKIKELGVTHIWYTGVIEHATSTDYSSFAVLVVFFTVSFFIYLIQITIYNNQQIERNIKIMIYTILMFASSEATEDRFFIMHIIFLFLALTYIPPKKSPYQRSYLILPVFLHKPLHCFQTLINPEIQAICL